MIRSKALFTLSTFGLLGLFNSCVMAVEPGPSVTVPSDSNYREHYEWCKGAEDRLKAARGKPLDLIFIGDSITGMWDSAGLTVWNRHYAGRRALNFGAGGDKTQNALWRLQTWDLSGFSPKVAVVLIGTNNIDDSADDMVLGIRTVLDKTQALFPKAKLVLVSLLPRADWPGHAGKITAVNTTLRAHAAERGIQFLDINPQFTPLADSYRGLGPDKLHLNEEGYQIWANALEPLLRKELGEKN